MINQTEDQFYEEIGVRIRNYRLSANIGQEMFAELLNLTRASVVNMEKGRQRPSIFQLIRIANILKVDYIDLVPFDLNIERLPAQEGQVFDLDYSSVVAGSYVNLNDRVKNSMNQFLTDISKGK
jgi:transcriptional regulator with XRE-family HTH domain